MQFLGSILSSGVGQAAAGSAANNTLSNTDKIGMMVGNNLGKGEMGKWSKYGQSAGLNAPQLNLVDPMSTLNGLLSTASQGSGTSPMQLPSRPTAQATTPVDISGQTIGALGIPWQSLFTNPQSDWTAPQIQQVLPYLLSLGSTLNKRGR